MNFYEEELVHTARFDWRQRRRWGWRRGTGVDDLQVPGFLLAWIFSKHPLSDRNLAGPLVGTAGGRQKHERGGGEQLEASDHLNAAS